MRIREKGISMFTEAVVAKKLSSDTISITHIGSCEKISNVFFFVKVYKNAQFRESICLMERINKFMNPHR